MTKYLLGQKVKCRTFMVREKGGLELVWRRLSCDEFTGIVCGKRTVAEGSTR